MPVPHSITRLMSSAIRLLSERRKQPTLHEPARRALEDCSQPARLAQDYRIEYTIWKLGQILSSFITCAAML
jgi:hypothetical protein